ncbi:MAG: OPT family oligopeptide transporter [Pirellulales bacterium]
MNDDPTDIEYTPAPGEAQLTARAVVVGCLVGSVVSCTNIYIGLKIGWTFGASIISAVLGYSLFTMLGSLGKARRLTVLETNITQTAGSAAGSMASAAGLVAPIPAMALLGYEISWPALMAWSLSVAFLGVFFAVPLRRQMVEVDKLRFPTGTATAETILAMASEAGDAGAALIKARVLIWSGLGAGLFALAYHFVPQLESPPVHLWLTQWMPDSAIAGGIALAAAWSFKIYLGPSLFGAGLLIGPRVVLSLLLGSLVAWGILGPIAQQQGWAPGEVLSYANGPRGWILWPGVALMVSEAMTALALSWRTFVRALKLPIKADGSATDDSQQIPTSWWVGGLTAGSLLTLPIAYAVFGIPWYLTLIAIGLSSVLSIVAVRSTGETDINPVGGMGKVTQLVYGGIAPGQMGTNLMAAAITGAGASQAADMMQDLKTGHLLGASPRKQFIAQLFGICAGVLFVVPVYYLFSAAYEIGGERLPAPAAMAWKAMAELLANGLDSLPPHAEIAVAVAAGCGILLPLLRRIKWLAPLIPSGLAMGIAFIIPAFYSLVMFYGLIIWWVWRKVNRSAADKLSFAVASGLIAGEGLMGMVNAVLTLLGVEPIT